MKGVLLHLLHRHPLATAVLAAAFIALTYFSWQLVDGTRLASRPPEVDLELWMSPRFVARSWNIPRESILRIMEIDPETGRKEGPRTLGEVLERTGLTLEELQRRVEVAGEEVRLQRSLPGREESGS